MPRFRLCLLLSLLGLFVGREVPAATSRMTQVAQTLGIEASSPPAADDQRKQLTEGLVQQVLAEHPDRARALALLRAREAERDAAAARWQPQIAFDGEIFDDRFEQDPNAVTGTASGDRLRLELRQNVWRGGQDRALLQIADRTRELAKLAEQEQTEALAFAVRQAAVEYNYRAMRLLIDEAAQAEARELLQLAQKKFAAGQVGRVDVYTTQLRDTSAEAAVQRARYAKRQAWLELAALRPPNQADTLWSQAEQQLAQTAWLPKGSFPEASPTSVLSLNEQSAVAERERADASLQQKWRARYAPTLDLIGAASQSRRSEELSSPNGRRSSANDSLNYSVGLQLSWLLWDRVGTHEVRAASAEKVAAEAAAQQARQEITTQKLVLRSSIEGLQEGLTITRKAYLQAGQLYNAQRKLYESGVISLQPLIEADNEQLRTLSEWWEQQRQLHLGRLRWEAFERGYVARQNRS